MLVRRRLCEIAVESWNKQPEAQALLSSTRNNAAGHRPLAPSMRSGPSAAITSCKARRHRKRNGGPSGTPLQPDRLGPRQQRSGRGGSLFLAAAKPIPPGIAVDGLRRKNGLGSSGMAVLGDQPADAARSQTGAQTIDKTASSMHFTAAYADLSEE
jgi:hypothetical protein